MKSGVVQHESGRKLQHERVSRCGPYRARQSERAGVGLFQGPIEREREPVQRSSPLRFVDRKLVLDAVEAVRAVRDPVGPRRGNNATVVRDRAALRKRDHEVPAFKLQDAERSRAGGHDGGVAARTQGEFGAHSRRPACSTRRSS